MDNHVVDSRIRRQVLEELLEEAKSKNAESHGEFWGWVVVWLLGKIQELDRLESI